MPGAQFGKRVASAKRNGGSHSAQSSPTKEGNNRHHNASSSYSSTQSFPLVAEAKQQQPHPAQDDGNDANGGGVGGPRVTTKTGRGGKAKTKAAVEVECGSPVSPGTDSEDLHHQPHHQEQGQGAGNTKELALMTSSLTSSSLSSSTTNLSVFLDGESGSNDDDELYSACEQGDVPAVRVSEVLEFAGEVVELAVREKGLGESFCLARHGKFSWNPRSVHRG